MAGPTKTADRRQRRREGEGAPPARPPSEPGRAPSVQRAPRRLRLPGGRRLRLPGRRALVLLLVLALALSGFGVWALYGSGWLRVERVGVDGTRVLTERQVRAAADVPLGAPVISVDRSAVERRLEKHLPRIAEADVVRAWPHGIGLKVTERKPELALKKAGKYIEVDAEGVRFATVPKPPKGVPLLDMEVAKSPSLRHFGATRLRKEAVKVAAALPESVHRDTRVIRVRSYDAITFQLKGGRTVLWGSAERGEAKAKTLTALMKAAKEAEHFDVSVPSAPAASGS
ncbi:cell division protein FtsQ/DivIB [Streptomyces daliensis]|uniref:Cell division protein FtsQ n=1 Tax=Streptomyces daliensis TaxID=299421 RepID=A0A8T4IK15_9ACTN|nr:FtsQ-type POTRA domain-containing protein [Streptomyces daliensis]